MTERLTINFQERKIPSKGTIVFFAAKGRLIGNTLKKIDKESGGQILKAMSVADFDGKKNQKIEILAPASQPACRLIIVGIGDTVPDDEKELISLGGKIGGFLKGSTKDEATIFVEDINKDLKISSRACAAMASGFRLRSYQFKKYKSGGDKGPDDQKNGDEPKGAINVLNFGCAKPASVKDAFTEFDALCEGIFTARDLVNEPGNVLGPVEFALRTRELEELGVQVTILDEDEMSQNSMNALLAVGQGSERPSRLVVMHWNGTNGSKEKPLAIVGKGVSFDSGGISIKPSQGMEDMKGDMGGAACVAGLMHTLAKRKSKCHVVGVIGLAENMPDGKAQRPGDVVTSMSGQTIEVINTDAEGRLVLADALTYVKQTYKPKLIIDLATLTGAILVALGKEHAGLFSNNDRLVGKLLKAGDRTGEKLWRLPLGDKYDKLIDSQIADMKNVGGRYAGSITAAQFLQRFVDDVPWAHIDVAGTAMGSPKTDINQSWGSGYGVMLLNEFIAANYE